MVRLKDLLKGIRYKTGDELSGTLKINKVINDSRAIGKGDLFIAFRGYAADGHRFIREAISKGAIAVLAEKKFSSPRNVTKILVDDTMAALPIIADNFYKHPSERLRLIGVTGTNGKTTITYIIEHILKIAGKRSGVIGTINYRFNNKVMSAPNTTPGPLELQAMLADMVRGKVGYVIMEVSSHSLDQHRVDRLSFDAAVFTNLAPEHLDYHKTIDNYFNAKAKLFDKLKSAGVAILNNDDKRVRRLKNLIKRNIITYGIGEGADIMADGVSLSLDGTRFTVKTPDGPIEVSSRLIGRHNVSNILAAVAVCRSEGIALRAIKNGIESFNLVPGRLEPVTAGQPFKVFVDYAHTEDALYNVLSLLKDVGGKSRIVTVFGCGGNRDRSKRPLMGKTACRFSDKVIITSDNPRFEDPARIIGEITKGLKGLFHNYDVVEDRRRAIKAALNSASKDDIVVIAGKGHERCQIVKNRIIPFDDGEVAKEILKKRYAEALQ